MPVDEACGDSVGGIVEIVVEDLVGGEGGAVVVGLPGGEGAQDEPAETVEEASQFELRQQRVDPVGLLADVFEDGSLLLRQNVPRREMPQGLGVLSGVVIRAAADGGPLDTLGTFAHTVEDAALMLTAMAGYDPQDFSSSKLPVPDFSAAVDSQQSPPRIGVVRQFFYERADEEVKTHTDGMLERLARAGAAVDDVTLPTDFETLLAAHRVLMTVEAAAVHEQDFAVRPDDYGPNVRGVIEAGMLTPAVSYVQAQRIRRRFRRDMEEAIQAFDVLLTPSTATPAPRDLTTTGDPSFQSPWTTCGFPTISLPSGLSESGLPLGIQLAAAPFQEETLLAAARWSERTLDVELVPPEPA